METSAMNLLVVGGSGNVGTLILPSLKEHLRLRVFDLKPPADPDVEYLSGDVNDPVAVAQALTGVDAVAYMAVPGVSPTSNIQLQYDVNVKGLHVVLQAACEAGIRRAVYTSTGSVHKHRAFYCNEDVPRDSGAVYGFTKGLGERVCQWFCQTHGMSIVALRLWHAVSRHDWLQGWKQGDVMLSTADRDVARAVLAALTCRAAGFHAVFISGDCQGKVINMTRARELLGWEPLERPA